VAHFVTSRLALNSAFQLKCQQKFNFWAAGWQTFTYFPSSLKLLFMGYVPFLYCATTVAQLCSM
jgi:hypothetical protein